MPDAGNFRAFWKSMISAFVLGPGSPSSTSGGDAPRRLSADCKYRARSVGSTLSRGEIVLRGGLTANCILVGSNGSAIAFSLTIRRWRGSDSWDLPQHPARPRLNRDLHRVGFRLRSQLQR